MLDITLSIVSHEQGQLVASLLSDIQRELSGDFEVLLTLNVPENEDFLNAEFSFPLKIIRNAQPKGFGANHNAAFVESEGQYFAVINPDIRLFEFNVEKLLSALREENVAVCGPAVLAPDGRIEDSARRFPSIWNMIKRRVLGNKLLDYGDRSSKTYVDWLGGMFLIFKREEYRSVNGFDERYFMYMEDVDICRRLKSSGRLICYEPTCKVIHDARRNSHRNIRHLSWHLTSAALYFISR